MRKLILFLLVCSPAIAQDTLTGLVGAWKTIEGSGTSVADSSSSGYNLTVTGATWSGAISPLTNSLVYASGNHSDTSAYANLNFDYTQAFSISTWIAPSTAAEQTVISRLNTGSNFIGWEMENPYGAACDGFGASICVGFFLINTYPSNAIEVDGKVALSLGAWNHVVITYDGSHSASGVKFYLNGTQETGSDVAVVYDTLTATTVNTEDVRLGSRLDGSEQYLGDIGATYIYNRVLVQADVTALYNSPYTLSASKVRHRVVSQ